MSIRIAAVGLGHAHIYNQVASLLKAGAELVWLYSDEPERTPDFLARYPYVQQARTLDEILEDPTIQMVVSAVAPYERAPLGIRVMQHGKDYSAAKPAFISLEQLEQVKTVQADTGRIYAVHFSERFDNAATVKAGELVHAGAIGQVIQMTGFGPHRLLGHNPRPAWAYDTRLFGGILNDLASHQIDQFLYFTRSTHAEILSARVDLVHHQQFPHMEDFGEVLLRSATASGFIRVDWLTPDGLATWGDVRLFLLGTDGYIELRKNIDIGGRSGANHLFWVDRKGTQYIDCANHPLPYGKQLIADVLNRTQTANLQAQWFLACELALLAQQKATSAKRD